MTKVGDVSVTKKVMDQAMVRGMLDTVVAQLEASSKAREEAAKANHEAKEAAERAEHEAEKAEHNAETLKQREDRIRDRHEMRDFVKNFVGQFVDTGDHNTQTNTNPPVSASIPNQSQGALGMGPCHSGMVSNGDQTSRRGRSKDRDALQDGTRCQSDDARQNQKERVYWHKHHQPQPQSNSKHPQYSSSQNQYQNSQNQQNSNFQN
ncbi:MAG: hypothetical protein GY820_28850, partial [Gammaproteobacteria bacterium]|nr:hypothetical protein [Gammaproteobacteria bacterium]